MRERERLNLILVLLWPIIAVCISAFLEETGIFHQNFFVSIILFLALPSIYLSFYIRDRILKIFIASLVGSIPIMIIVEYFGQLSNTWSFPPSVFPFSIGGLIIIEALLWAFFNVYYVIIFYEYFLDHHVIHHLVEPRMKYLLIGLLMAFVLFIFVILNFSTRSIPYFYFIFGVVVFAIPVILQFTSYSHHKKIVVKMVKAGAYFFYLSFIYELVALHYGWWSFPSENFIGWVILFNFRFPIEELTWWIMLFALAVLSCYEFFDNNEPM